MRRTLTRFGSAVLGLVGSVGLGGLGGCSNTELIIDIGNIPAAATELRAILRSDGQQSHDIPRFGFAEGRSTFSMGLRLRDRQSGMTQITVGSFRDGCPISTGILSLDDLAERPERLSLNLAPPRSDVLLQGCPDSVPILISAEAAYDRSAQQEHLVINGWGFDPTARVFLADRVTEASGKSSINPLVLRVDLPELVPPINNQLKVHIANPDGSTADKTFTVSLPVLDPSSAPLYPQGDQDPFLLMADVAIDDLDGDGFPDVILAGNSDTNAAGRVRVYWNNGAGAFTPGPLLPISGTVRRVAGASLRGGGLHDLVLTAGRLSGMGSSSSFVSGNVVILQQLTARSFSPNPLTSAEGADVGLVPYAVVATDLNGDSVTDLAVVTNAAANPSTAKGGFGTTQQLRIYDGTQLQNDRFQPLVTRDITAQGAPLALVAGDLGVVSGGPYDLAIARPGAEPSSGAVDVYENPGDGHFERAGFETILLEGRPGALAVADLDRDGRSDLAASILFTLQGSQEVYGTTANILFRRNPQWLKQTVLAGLAPLGIAAADLQSNGILDLVVTNLRIDTQPALMGLLFNLGGGQFASSTPTMIELPTAAGALVTSGDLNGDGRSDLAVAPTGIASGASKHTGSLLTYFGL